MALDGLQRGEKVDVHMTLYVSELEVLDALRDKYRCSRAAVMGAMIAEFRDKDLNQTIPAGNRPGAGQPKKEPSK